MTKLQNAQELNSLRDKVNAGRDPNKKIITICGGTGCQASKCQDIIDAVNVEVKNLGLEDKVDVRVTGCHGLCEKGPIMVIHPDKIF